MLLDWCPDLLVTKNAAVFLMEMAAGFNSACPPARPRRPSAPATRFPTICRSDQRDIWAAAASGAIDEAVASADVGAVLLTEASIFALPRWDATTGLRSAWTGFGLNWGAILSGVYHGQLTVSGSDCAYK
jgi:hypothetical protein